MKKLKAALGMGALGMAALMAAPLFAQNVGQGTAVVTVLPKDKGKPLPPSVAQQDLSVKVNGHNAKVTEWKQFKGPNNRIELVLLIDGSSRNSLGREMGEIEQFVRGLPPNVAAGIAYMVNGQAVFAGPLSSDHAAVLKNLHLPGGIPGGEASPYFCLSDLAKHWPGRDSEARREVLMVTDGVDDYERRYDPDDPYVNAAIKDATRARLVVYSIFWTSMGRMNRTEYAANTGQNLLEQVSDATGGKSFWQGMGNPISFMPYFDDLTRRFENQWELGFTAPLNGNPDVETMKLDLHAPGTEISAPQQVFVAPAGTARTDGGR